MPKRAVINVLRLQQNPVGSLILVQPSVRIAVDDKSQNIEEKPKLETADKLKSDDGYYGNSFKFIQKDLKYNLKSEENNKVKIVVYDIDAHGAKSEIARNVVDLVVGDAWLELVIDPQAVDGPEVEAVLPPLFIRVSTKIEDYEEPIGVEEKKESEPVDSSKPIANYIKVRIDQIESLNNEGKTAKDTNSYIKVKYGDKAFPATPTIVHDLNPVFNYAYWFKLSDGLPKEITLEVMDKRMLKDKALATYILTPGEILTGSHHKQESKGTKSMVRQPSTEGLVVRDGFRRVDHKCELDAGISASTGHSGASLDVGTVHVSVWGLNLDTAQESELGDALRTGKLDIDGDDDEEEEEEDDDKDGSDGEDEEKKDKVEEKKDDKAAAAKAATKLSPEEQKKADAEKKKKMEADLAAIQNITIEDGDYQVTVNIIEVKGLVVEKAEAPDPVVQVFAWGQKKTTEIKPKSTSAFYDQQLIFNLKGMTLNKLMDGVIRVEVVDAAFSLTNMMAKSPLIGSWQTDFDYIYYKPDHEYYRMWVPIMGATELSGWLFLSVTILGPNDKPKEHDRKKEMEEEEKAKAKKGGGLKSEIPQMKQELQFLVATVYRAEDLPATDDSLVDKYGIDAFVQVQFGDGDPAKTKVVSIKGDRKTIGPLNPTFKQELWIPFLSPCMTSRIDISVYDREEMGVPPELVASTSSIPIKMVKKYPEQYTAFWAPLYGAQMNLGMTKKNQVAEMNAIAENATLYRGRLLLSLRVEENRGGLKMNKAGTKMIKKKIIRVNKLMIKNLPQGTHSPKPPTRDYRIRFRAFVGSEMPEDTMKNGFSIQLNIGPYTFTTQIKKSEKGLCYFNPNEALGAKDTLILPEDLLQCPWIYIYLVRVNDVSKSQEVVSYYTLNPKELFEQDKGDIKPTWYELWEEPIVNAIPSGRHPGNVLLQIEFSEASKMPEAEDTMMDASVAKADYQARVYILQGREIPATDEDGLCDPFVKVQFAGQQLQTKVQENQKNPLFYECLNLEAKLPVSTGGFDARDIMPMMIMQVYDSDGPMISEYIGANRLPMYHSMINYYKTNERKVLEKAEDGKAPQMQDKSWVDDDGKMRTHSWVDEKGKVWDSMYDCAEWLPLGREKEGDVQGEILVAVELIEVVKGHPAPKPPKNADLKPKTKEMYLEFIAVGCRDLKTVNPLGLRRPYVEFRIGNQLLHKSEPSCRPSSVDPNFQIDHKIVPFEIPVSPKFAPALNIEVHDFIFGGWQTPLIGSTYIPLDERIEKLPDGSKNPLFSARKGLKTFKNNPYLDMESEMGKLRKAARKEMERSGSKKHKRSLSKDQSQKALDMEMIRQQSKEENLKDADNEALETQKRLDKEKKKAGEKGS